MPRIEDTIWKNFLNITSVHGKLIKRQCLYCKAEFFPNATRAKKHLVADCPYAPLDVKQQFLAEVNKQCFTDKRKVSLEVSNDLPVKRKLSSPSTSSLAMAGVGKVDDDELSPESSSDCEVDVTSDVENGEAAKLQDTSSSVETIKSPKQIDGLDGMNTSAKVNKTFKSSSILPFTDRMSEGEQRLTNKHFARAIFSSASPLSMTESNHWQTFFKQIRPSWKPPSRYQLSVPLLDAEFEDIRSDNDKTIAQASCLVLMSDGWSCTSGDSHIQFLVGTPLPVFVKSIHSKENRHTGDYIAEEMIKVIEEFGASKFRGCITDNAANMKSAWQTVQQTYPKIFCFGCLSHSLNLLAGDIEKLTFCSELLSLHKELVLFFRRHQVPKAILERCSKDKLGKCLMPLLPVQTRWSSAYNMLKRNIKLRDCYRLAITEPECAGGRNNVISNDLQNHLLDPSFWSASETVRKLLKPIADTITESEGNNVVASVAPEIFKYIHNVYEDVLSNGESTLTNDDKQNILSALSSREDFVMKPVHYAANILDPRFRGQNLTETETLLGENVIMDLANELGIDITNDLMEFKARTGSVFGVHRAYIWNADMATKPLLWWKAFASSRSLGRVAEILLSLNVTIAAVERTNKQFSIHKSKKRNRLTDARATKLTYVAYNLKTKDWAAKNSKPQENSRHLDLTKKLEVNHIVESEALSEELAAPETEISTDSSFADSIEENNSDESDGNRVYYML